MKNTSRSLTSPPPLPWEKSAGGKLFSLLLKLVLVCVLLGFGTTVWYYFLGRKPKLVWQASVPEGSNSPEASIIGQGQLASVVGETVRVFDVATGSEIWKATLHDPFNVQDAIQPLALDSEKGRLMKWANDLAKRREQLKTAEDIAAFNAEAARYKEALDRHNKGGSASAKTAATKADPKAKTESAKAPKPAAPQINNAATDDADMLRSQIEKRTTAGAEWYQKIVAKEAQKLTTLQKQDLAEEKQRYAADQQELKALVAKLQSLSTPRQPAGKAVAAAGGTTTTNEVLRAEESPEFLKRFEGGLGPSGFVSDVDVYGSEELVIVVRGARASAFGRHDGKVRWHVAVGSDIARVHETDHFLFFEGPERVVRVNASTGAAEMLRVVRAQNSHDYGQPLRAVTPGVLTAFDAEGLVTMDVRVIEEKISVREGIKTDSAKDWAEAEKKATAYGADLSGIMNAISNDAARELGADKEFVDESTYEITVRRPFGNQEQVWKETITGIPAIFGTESLIVVAAGKRVITLEPTLAKRWEALLGQPVDVELGSLFSQRFSINDDDDDEIEKGAQVIEHGDRLYVVDRGFLTAFNALDGQPIWRFPSVGIFKTQFAASGDLYLLTRNASAESLRYRKQSRAEDAGNVLLFKLNPANGQPVWQQANYQNCYIVGDRIYATRAAHNAFDGVNAVFDGKNTPQVRFNLHKLSAKDGKSQWSILRFYYPLRIQGSGSLVMMLFNNELEVHKSLAF